MFRSDRLIYLRESKNLKKQDMASILNIDKSTYGKYENGQRLPSYDILEAIANFFNVSIDYLFGRDNNSHSTAKEQLSSDEKRVISYYNRLNMENKDYIKGEMIKLYKQQDNISR